MNILLCLFLVFLSYSNIFYVETKLIANLSFMNKLYEGFAVATKMLWKYIN